MRPRFLLAVIAASLLAAGGGAAARSAAGPVNTAPPTITGTVKVGGSVAATPGTWTSSTSIAYAYQWVDCDAQGNGCQPLPYTTQTVTSLRALVGSTIRAVVTATDTTGSATASSAPATVLGANAGSTGSGGSDSTRIAFVKPVPGSVVHTPKVTITVRVTSTVPVRSVAFGGARARSRGHGLWSLTEKVEPGNQRVDVGADGAHKTLRFTVIPPITAVQDSGTPGALVAPGCFTCIVRDPRGDDHGGPPDIKTVSSTYKGGWITITLVTYDNVSPGHGGHPCVDGLTTSGPHERGFDAGCFEGPHTGMIFGDACAHPDANQDCGSAHMSFPNSHTTAYRFRPVQIGSPTAFFWDAWVLYPGDAFKDTAPSSGERPGPGQPGLYCQVKQQLRAQPPSSYGWGRNRCSQRLVSVAR